MISQTYAADVGLTYVVARAACRLFVTQLMAKIEKSAVELAKLIRRQLAEPNLRIAVYPKVTGWHARVYAEEGAARDLQKRVDEVVRELNGIYHLES